MTNPTIQELRREIKDLTDRIELIQTLCSHPTPCHEIKTVSVEDEFGRSTKVRRQDHHCSLCEKRWTEILP